MKRPLKRYTLPKKARRRVGLSGSQRDRLDELHRDAVMIRYGAFKLEHASGKGSGWYGPCLKCGKMRYLQVSHIHPKGRMSSARWIVENAFALCGGCHKYWWHSYPHQATAFTLEQLGPEGDAALRIRCQTASKPDFQLTRLYLSQELERLLLRPTP